MAESETQIARFQSIPLPCTYKEWEKLKRGLDDLASKKIRGVEALEEILEDNDRWENVKLPLTLLRSVLSKGEHITEDHFCESLLPWLAKKALDVEEVFRDMKYELPNLFAGKSGQVTLTRHQVCCLIALAFFNAFEDLRGCYQQFTLAGFLSFALYASQRGKLLCLLHYFDRLREEEEAGNNAYLSLCISVTRKQLGIEKSSEVWGECDAPLVPFESLGDGLIEEADGCLQVDFANSYIGGGVLGMGNVQEEIRFVINPECLVSILFCQEMKDNESILISGAEQFSNYSGYGGRFAYTGPHEETDISIDEQNRKCVSIVAIDATPFMYGSSEIQFQNTGIIRELNKAYCGFSHCIPGDESASNGKMVPVATGNWGCGVFGGNKELKTLIQWVAASRVGRPVRYYTFKDAKLTSAQMKVTKTLLDHKVTVGQLYKMMVAGTMSRNNVFDTVLKTK